MRKLSMWLRQPTSVAGVSAVFGTITALMLKQMNLVEAAPLLAGAAISIILPDNSVAKQEIEALTKEVVGQVAGASGASA
jgi:hypothetical protein